MIIFIRTFLILSLILLFSCKNNKEVSKPEIKNEDLNILMIASTSWASLTLFGEVLILKQLHD